VVSSKRTAIDDELRVWTAGGDSMLGKEETSAIIFSTHFFPILTGRIYWHKPGREGV
jgi:hypothetical protein